MSLEIVRNVIDLIGLGRAEEAAELLEAVAEADSQTPAYLIAHATFLRETDPERSLATAEQAIAAAEAADNQEALAWALRCKGVTSTKSANCRPAMPSS